MIDGYEDSVDRFEQNGQPVPTSGKSRPLRPGQPVVNAALVPTGQAILPTFDRLYRIAANATPGGLLFPKEVGVIIKRVARACGVTENEVRDVLIARSLEAS